MSPSRRRIEIGDELPQIHETNIRQPGKRDSRCFIVGKRGTMQCHGSRLKRMIFILEFKLTACRCGFHCLSLAHIDLG